MLRTDAHSVKECSGLVLGCYYASACLSLRAIAGFAQKASVFCVLQGPMGTREDRLLLLKPAPAFPAFSCAMPFSDPGR